MGASAKRYLSMKRVIMAVAFLALLAAGGIAYQTFVLKAAEPPRTAQNAAPAVPVLIAPATRKAMPVRLDAIGTVQPIATVAVKSRVDGQIAEVKISDGQAVKTGDVLFILDTRAASAQLMQAEAALAKDRAQLENAKRDVARFKPLTEKEFVSRQQFDTAQTNAAALEATLLADQATVDNFKVQLSYYTIRSPMDGRVGTIGLKTGNAVKAQDTISLVTINQIKPIYASYAVPQRELPGVRAAMSSGTVPVQATVPGDPGPPITGKIFFFDNQIDPTTGTISLKAIFDNADERLWPGEFVNVSTTLRVDPDAIVVPASAVQVGQTGSFVYVVKADNTVEFRPVTVSRTINNESVITKGLNGDERVVTDGQLRLTNGSRVEIRTSNTAGAVAESRS
ncbi:MAG TPA: efflux RND transporter periplasmic adaptor subunit [Stellaceae bacterium]|nr:efflux RND transporter periplasmic adaptor subunit [Stellaceae bacterium]